MCVCPHEKVTQSWPVEGMVVWGNPLPAKYFRIFRVSEIASGAICEAKIHYAGVVALWYICFIKTICDLLKVLVVGLLIFSSTDSAYTKALGHYSSPFCYY